MKNLLIVLGIIFAYLAVFWLIFYPRDNLTDRIQSLKSAPEKLICERETPTAVHVNYYADDKAGWRAVFVGKNKKDTILELILFPKNSSKGQMSEFVFIGGAWKPINELASAERKAFEQQNGYTEEENKFLGYCIDRIFEYITEKDNRKFYTPVLFAKKRIFVSAGLRQYGCFDLYLDKV